jgi:hypothetical protein
MLTHHLEKTAGKCSISLFVVITDFFDFQTTSSAVALDSCCYCVVIDLVVLMALLLS